jgi:aryl-alcohol dehydrogenase-like predicted oxidoreductase
MELRPFGRTGICVPPLCLGTMIFGRQIDEATSFAIMDKALDSGVDFFDTANIYAAGETESIIGRWLKDRGLRDRILLASKCWAPMGPTTNDKGLSRFSIQRAVEASLERLGTDVIDLYQVHAFDGTTPIDETLRALDDLVRAGKVRYIGCSNFPAWRLAEAHGVSERLRLARFESVQPRFNLMYREIETELLPYARESSTAVLVYNPLAGGVLSGKYRKGEKPAAGTRYATLPEGPIADLYHRWYFQEVHLDTVRRLHAAVQQRGVSLTTLAIAWVVQRPGVTAAIIGASHPDQLDETLPAVDLEIDDELAALCDSLWWSLPREPVVEGYR